MVLNSDINLLSVIQFAVEVLKIKDIIVCGHYGCGGVIASTKRHDAGLIENWLRNIRDVQRLHFDELIAITDPEEKHKRLVELNVVEQSLNLYKNNIIQKYQHEQGYPRIHPLVYDIGEGLLKPLNDDIKEYCRRYTDVYSVVDFPK